MKESNIKEKDNSEKSVMKKVIIYSNEKVNIYYIQCIVYMEIIWNNYAYN